MPYAGQEHQTNTEELLFTEHDRRHLYRAIKDVPSVGKLDVLPGQIFMPNFELYFRWHRLATEGDSHQARFLLDRFHQAYRDVGREALEQSGYNVDLSETPVDT